MLGDRVTGVIDNLEPGFFPVLLQQQGLINRTHHVVSSMHDKAGNMTDPVHVFDQLPGSQETLVAKIVALESRDAEGDMRIAEMVDNILIG